jgi:soluble lytic murein transglycosylase-like protein
MKRSSPIRRKAAVLAMALAVAAPGFARAQVLEIGDDGAVTTYDRPTVFTDGGAKPIAAPRVLPAVFTRQPSAEVRAELAQAAAVHALPPALLNAVAWRESRYNSAAVSPAGAIGVMQLMPGTARQLGVDPYDLRQNIHGGAAYLTRMLGEFRGDLTLALAAYNAGPAAVRRYNGVPPYAETRAYVAGILGQLARDSAPRITIE